MTEEIYVRLRERLDTYSVGFPATESGVEFRMLEKLFTPDEAALFLDLALNLQTPEAIAETTGRDIETLKVDLERMTAKGLIFRLRRGGAVKYAAMPFAVGFYEFQLGRMDEEFARLFEQYWQESSRDAFAHAGGLMRPIPVSRSVDSTLAVAPYDDLREIVKKQKLIALADCICRTQQSLIGHKCDKPLDVCLTFGSMGQAYLDLGMARQITPEEAVSVLDRAEKAGLVPQPANLQTTSAICNCCGDCCGVLRSLNLLEKPAEAVTTNYFAAVDPDECTGCETCLTRCQMGAITMNDDQTAEINLDRCIGCGLCVTTCPTEALTLELKPEGQRVAPPTSGVEMMMNLAAKRGLI